MLKNIFAILAALLLSATMAIAGQLEILDVNVSHWPQVTIKAAAPEGSRDFSLRLQSNSQTVQATSVQMASGPEAKRNLVLLVDASKSLTSGELTAIKDAFGRFLDQTRADDQTALLYFNDTVQIASGFTTNTADLKKALDSITLGGNKTELYRALLYSVELLKQLPGSKEILLISDGKDEGHDISLDQVLQAARNADVSISCVGLRNAREKNPEKYLNILDELATRTSGFYSSTSNPAELKAAAYEILLEHRKSVKTNNIYTLTFDLGQTDLTAPTEAELACLTGAASQTNRLLINPPAPKAEAAPVTPAASPAPDVPAVSPALSPQQEAVAQSFFSLENKFFLWTAAIAAALAAFLLFLFFRRNKKAEPLPPINLETAQKPAEQSQSPWSLDFASLGLSYPLTPGRLRLGAAADNDIRIDEPTVSGHHAEFQLRGDECYVRDLQSTNGVKVNNVIIREDTQLHPGDRLRFGNVIAVLRCVRQPANNRQTIKRDI